MSIYIKGEKPKTIKELLERFLLAIKAEFSNCYKACETYHNKECTIVQCKEDKVRSFDDIYECITTYFPETSKKEAVHYLLMMKDTEKPVKLFFGVCLDMCRIRLLLKCEKTNTYIDEYKIKFDSENNWEELFALLGLKPIAEEIDKYIENEKQKQLCSSI